MDPIVCTYVIEDTSFSESEGFSLSASMGAHWLVENSEDPLYSEWLDSGYRKHFRRAKTAAFEKLIAELPGTILVGETTRLWASSLMRSEAIPKSVKRLQMSNFTLALNKSEEEKEALVRVAINSELEMSFGKAAVAAAHAAQNLAIGLKAIQPASLDIWKGTGYANIATRGTIVKRSTLTGSVQDFGLTEVPAGSTTAQAFLIDRYIKERN